VPYGQHICRPVSPLCSQCPLTDYCDRVGVTHSR
jgi:endonuclease-3